MNALYLSVISSNINRGIILNNSTVMCLCTCCDAAWQSIHISKILFCLILSLPVSLFLICSYHDELENPA